MPSQTKNSPVSNKGPTPRKRGKQWELCYRCPGYSKPIYERFPSYEAAKLRSAEIEYERSIGELRPPRVSFQNESSTESRFITVEKLLEDYVELYGMNHWGDSYLSYTRHRIKHYINPYIGKMFLRDLTPHDLDHFYRSLRDKPAVILKGHKAADKTISPHVIEKIHALMKSALKQAVAWGWLQTNPAESIILPKPKSQPRKVWTIDQAQQALSHCSDPALRLAMLLALGCSLRIGEILGLTWDCVEMSDESIANGTAGLFINKELKRCDNTSLQDLSRSGRSNVLFTFPNQKQDAKTSLVLKDPKTASSVRTVFLPETVSHALREWKAAQDADKELLEAAYTDYNMVLAHEDGRPYEEGQITDKFRKLIRDSGLPPVVFHSLRHCSTTIKLQISGGNIKAVQGDTGHAQARMVTDLYAHINNEDRRKLAQKMEQDFFQGSKEGSCAQAPACAQAPENEAALALRLLQENPDMARLVIAALGGKPGDKK